jgi:hypothetical protein
MQPSDRRRRLPPSSMRHHTGSTTEEPEDANGPSSPAALRHPHSLSRQRAWPQPLHLLPPQEYGCALCLATPQPASLRLQHATTRDPRRLQRARNSSPRRLSCGLPSQGRQLPRYETLAVGLLFETLAATVFTIPSLPPLFPQTATFSLKVSSSISFSDFLS